MRNAFIVGISGFVGKHLSRFLADDGWNVSGYDRQAARGFPAYVGDLLDRAVVEKALLETRPDVIFHLAGVLKSEQPEQFYTTHVLGTVSLLDVVVKNGMHPTVLIASSSAVYGAGVGGKPITEGFKPRPVTHYAVSKLAQEMAALRYWTAFGLPIILVRTFNLLGPGLSPEMACSAFARQIAQAERQGRPAAISTGNLDSKRDFVDVRDAACAYALLAEKGCSGQVYNVASERAVGIRECLDFLRKHARVPIEIVTDQRRAQQNDIPIQVGSAERLRLSTGWKAGISFEQSLLDMLEDWRNKIRMEQ